VGWLKLGWATNRIQESIDQGRSSWAFPNMQLLVDHFHEKHKFLRALHRLDAAMVQSARMKAAHGPCLHKQLCEAQEATSSGVFPGPLIGVLPRKPRTHIKRCSRSLQVNYVEVILICNSLFEKRDPGICNALPGFSQKTEGWSQPHNRGYELTMLVLFVLADLEGVLDSHRGIPPERLSTPLVEVAARTVREYLDDGAPSFAF
jgi:hypothetical protein